MNAQPNTFEPRSKSPKIQDVELHLKNYAATHLNEPDQEHPMVINHAGETDGDDMDKAWRTCNNNVMDRSIKQCFSATHGQDLSLMNDEDIEHYFASALQDKKEII